jgi:hypothetical protein
MHGDGIELTGPCGADAWYIESGEDDDPQQVVARLSRNLLGEPLLVHSTSWRRDRRAVILSFVVVIGDDQAIELPGVEVGRSELARNSASAAPTHIARGQVLEHALRHLAWLVKDDEVVGAALSDRWKSALSAYVPEPFRHLGSAG